MPKALQKRGRRIKRKHDDEAEETVAESSNKRQKSIDQSGEQHDFMSLHHGMHEDVSAAYPSTEKAFFGMLDEDEQTFFKAQEELLESDDFATPEERAQLLSSIWKEAAGKELKLACSQSCSRLLERVLRSSTSAQLKQVFQAFSGNFIHLLSHRFASHCCETLFTCAAPHVSEELKGKRAELPAGVDELYVSMENLFLHTIAELEGNIGFLLTDRYASHSLRILLLIFSGQAISTDSMKALLGSKRKEGHSEKSGIRTGDDSTSKSRPVPKSFSGALEKLMSDSVVGLDTNKLRGLATHPMANPTLQLLLTIELTYYGKQRGKEENSILRTLLPDDPFTAESDSAAFISSLVYDSVGSHLVEKIIQHSPAKFWKSLYKNFFKERLLQYSRNEVATHVVCTILERLGYDDLLEAHELILPVIPTLLEKQWTALTRTLIERCAVRDIDTQPIAVQIDQFYQDEKGTFNIEKMLNPQHPRNSTEADLPPTKVHFNILAQGMLIVSGSLSALLLDSLIALDSQTLIGMARDPIITRTLQQALTTKNASIIQRRKLIQRFYGNIGEMALDKAASHVVDCIWEGTHGLAFIRERIAEELAENEASLRDSACGRAVWKNWKMDIYKRRRREWIRQSKLKASNDGFQSFSELDQKKTDGPRKTPLQMARERHAKNKAKQVETEKSKEKSRDSKDMARKERKSASKSSRGSAGPSTRPRPAPTPIATT
ncbi:uncharacterized protein MYCFIDRAFT_33582 [Pseudocercospora fijiensis CIRAD86]|uniref:Nucleolar protein 9 n=1 Tax=Pseudocercospora fijiensis (strain CIRAD86) TaxID=383855 RepID=M3AKZ0_PSEFD|nr:uncharacterized protein MYCFIDRAFT_33582 [Pseudocercospora fijiensis CIRAD86]EME77803.1 hypothetical protein MYCFIDRAFT_33582 [Pseudocercospora fijiensis CIRAD86]